MSLNDLSEVELAEFARDPQAYLSNKKNQMKVLGLDDPELKKRLQGQVDASKLTAGLITAVVTQVPTII
jgi:hypothetical protein